MGRRIAVVGMQWGDEGKGKIVDLLGQDADVGVRFNGGNNAGHSVETKELGRRKVHLLPSVAFRSGVKAVLGNGMVFDPVVLMNEISYVRQDNPDLDLVIDGRAHLIFPHHKQRDAKEEADRGSRKIGTTKSGNGPAYSDKYARRGIIASDLLLPEKNMRDVVEQMVSSSSGTKLEVIYMMDFLQKCGESLRRYIGDGSMIINDAYEMGQDIIFAGAHGTMLDIDHGTYPYVTSSNCIASEVGPGCGFDPRLLTSVIGVVKAYSTRVGAGGYPSAEGMSSATESTIRDIGREYGTTTGRPRKIGWIDFPALRHAVRLNRPDFLAVTLLDVLSHVEGPLLVCSEYKRFETGDKIEVPNNNREYMMVQPQFDMMEGWKGIDISECRKYEHLPKAARRYLERIEEETGVRVGIVSVGPRRDQTINIFNFGRR